MSEVLTSTSNTADTNDDGVSSGINGAGEIDSSPKKKKLDKGASQNLKIIGVFFLVLILVVVIAFSRKSSNKDASTIAVNTANVTPTNQELTPDAKAKLALKQTQESAAAAAAGQTYIPPDTPSAVTVVNTGTSDMAKNSAPVLSQAAPMTGSVNSATTLNGFDAGSEQRRQEGLNRQLSAFMDGVAGGQTDFRQRINAADKGQGTGQNTTAATPAAAPATSTSAQSNKTTLLEGLAIASGQLANDIKVSEGGSGFASVEILAGPAKGAYLIGTVKTVDEGLEIALTSMRLGGKQYAVDALILDEKTANNAIEGNVDRRILQRYVFPVLLAATQGFYSAQAKTDQAVTVSINGVSQQQTAPTMDQARAAGVAEGVKIAAQQVNKTAQAPVVISRQKSYPVGILFRKPVFKEEGV